MGHEMTAYASRQVTYSIRDVRRPDVSALEASILQADETFSREWLVRQQVAGNLDYIAAWIKGIPVGQGVILWSGYAIPQLAADFSCTPVIRSVEVAEEYRGCGIGSAIVAELEARARARGYKYISLGVMPGNTHAENLWRYLGYKEWVNGIVTATSIYERTGGEELVRHEQFLPMRKRLLQRIVMPQTGVVISSGEEWQASQHAGSDRPRRLSHDGQYRLDVSHRRHLPLRRFCGFWRETS